MPAFHVQRTILIDAQESQVRSVIEDFAEWPKWSPWLCMEPTAQVNVHGTPGQAGHGYEWSGELVGAGSMRIAKVEAGTQFMDLEFMKPFKSRATVKLQLKPLGESQSEITWHMDGKLPFFMFFMVGTMKSLIGMDYVRGLKMLKEYVETGNVLSKTEVLGIVDVPGMSYVGVDARCGMDEIGESMSQTMCAASKAVADNQLEVAGPPGAVYHHVDLKKQTCHYSAIVQTNSLAEIDGVQTGQIEPCKALKIVHTGRYGHLGNAWSTAMAYQRNRKLKPLKTQPGFELYPNDAETTPEQELITEIYVPVRG